jgi:hypothetical protein
MTEADGGGMTNGGSAANSAFAMLSEDLGSLLAGAQPVAFAGGATHSDVGLRVEHSSDANGRVRPRLHQDLREHGLFEQFSALKQAFAVEIERIFGEGDASAVASTGQLGFSFVRVPTSWGLVFPNHAGANGTFLSLGRLSADIERMRQALNL